jgi:hypothetical protein
MNLSYTNTCKHKHEKNITRLWCKTFKNDGSYFYLYPFGDLVQGNFQGGFYLCVHQIKKLNLRTFLIKNQLKIN